MSTWPEELRTARCVLRKPQPGDAPALAPFIGAQGFLRTTPADLDLGDAAISGCDGFFSARLCKLPANGAPNLRTSG